MSPVFCRKRGYFQINPKALKEVAGILVYLLRGSLAL